MAEYVAFDPAVQVSGQVVHNFLNALPLYKHLVADILQANSIKQVDPLLWYDQKNFLACFKEIAQKYGPNTLFLIGKSCPFVPHKIRAEHAPKNITEALEVLDLHYQALHKKGDAGFYRLISCDAASKKATLMCKTPYPTEFDKGMLTATLRKYKPLESAFQEVRLQENMPTRSKGYISCTYLLSW